MDIAGKLSNVNGWIDLFILILIGVLAYFFVKAGVKLHENKSDTKVPRNRFYLLGFALGFSIFFFFFLFGKGTFKSPTLVKDTGEYKQLQEIGPEMSAEELKEDVLNRTTEELKIQSNDSIRGEYLEKSEKKSDEIIEKYLN